MNVDKYGHNTSELNFILEEENLPGFFSSIWILSINQD